MMKRTILLFILISSLFITSFVYAADPTDISNHWAQDYIFNLINNEIMETHPDGSFRPNKAITRGEFAVALAKQMSLVPDNNMKFTDLDQYPGYNLINALVDKNVINGYPDNTFRPDKEISRAEIIAIMIKSLGINDNKVTIELDNYQSFDDIPAKHWARNHIKIADKIDLINGDQNGNFNPENTASRAEAAKLLTTLKNYSSNTGYITDVYPTSQKVSINFLNGSREVYNFNDETLIGRNNRLVNLKDILKTDKVFIIANNDSKNIDYVKAYGMVTQDDIATEISTMTEGVFQPEEVKKLSSGNLDLLRPKLREAVKGQLAQQGLSQEEIDALMTTDWDELEELSRVRLAEAVAIQTGLPLDVTRSLINGDWEKVKSYAQIEIIQRIVQEVLDSDLIS